MSVDTRSPDFTTQLDAIQSEAELFAGEAIDRIARHLRAIDDEVTLLRDAGIAVTVHRPCGVNALFAQYRFDARISRQLFQRRGQ